MAEIKTKETEESVEQFIKNLPDEQKRKDCFTVVGMMKEVTGKEAKMWGSSIIGFGNYHCKYESGHEGDMCIIGFSPRKQNLTLYLNGGFDKQEELMKQLGKHTVGKGCLYIKKLEDIKPAVLKQLIATSFEGMAGKAE